MEAEWSEVKWKIIWESPGQEPIDLLGQGRMIDR